MRRRRDCSSVVGEGEKNGERDDANNGVCETVSLGGQPILW